MLQVARLSRKQLGDSAGLTFSFLQSQINEDGGFRDRDGNSDLYYTVFGLESFTALSEDIPAGRTLDYLRSFGDGRDLDFVHLACLARCWANVSREPREAPRSAILQRMESYRAADGGYNAAQGALHGTVYACFLALGAYQDLRHEMPRRMDFAACIETLRARDGGYANQPRGGDWINAPLRRGGDAASTPRPAPRCRSGRLASGSPPAGRRVLRLATGADSRPPFDRHGAARTLGDAGADRGRPGPCLDFIDSLWTNRGGFYGNWTDDVLDCEYLYYGLLALGHLSL